MNTRVIYFFYLYLCWATVVYSEKRMRARERGSEGVGLGYGDIGLLMFTTKVRNVTWFKQRPPTP